MNKPVLTDKQFAVLRILYDAKSALTEDDIKAGLRQKGFIVSDDEDPMQDLADLGYITKEARTH